MSLSLLGLFDDYTRKVHGLLQNDCTKGKFLGYKFRKRFNFGSEFLTFVRNQNLCRLQWKEAVDECQRLKVSLDKSESQNSDLEKALTRARMILHEQKERANAAEAARDEMVRFLCNGCSHKLWGFCFVFRSSECPKFFAFWRVSCILVGNWRMILGSNWTGWWPVRMGKLDSVVLVVAWIVCTPGLMLSMKSTPLVIFFLWAVLDMRRYFFSVGDLLSDVSMSRSDDTLSLDTSDRMTRLKKPRRSDNVFEEVPAKRRRSARLSACGVCSVAY